MSGIKLESYDLMKDIHVRWNFSGIKNQKLKFKGLSFNYIGAKAYKGDFIQTTSGKVLSQRAEGILYWEDIPFALPPLGNLRWKAPVAFVAEDFHINPKENNFCHQEIGGQIQEINQAGS